MGSIFELKKIKDRIYLLSFDDRVDLTAHFIRYQEMYESNSDNFKNKRFQLIDFIKFYIRDKGFESDFTYFSDWAGFNLPVSYILNGYPDLSDKNDHDHLMYSIAKYIDRDADYEPTYIIGASTGEDSLESTLRHEVAHGMFFTDDEYRDEMLGHVNKLPERKFNLLRDCLLNMGYCGEVVKDEMQAYLSTALSEIMFDIVSEKDMKPFIATFERYYEEK